MTKETNKLNTNSVSLILLILLVALFIVKEYTLVVIILGLLVVFFIISRKQDQLKKFFFNTKSGEAGVEFYQIPEENIKKDIKENKEDENNEETFSHYKNIEERILDKVQKGLSGEMKKKIHFVYGMPGHPEFLYTPDATIQTEKELIFLEIKYISRPEFTKKIVKDTVGNLKIILDKFGPSAGKKLLAKLVLVSNHYIDVKQLEAPSGIQIEFYKL